MGRRCSGREREWSGGGWAEVSRWRGSSKNPVVGRGSLQVCVMEALSAPGPILRGPRREAAIWDRGSSSQFTNPSPTQYFYEQETFTAASGDSPLTYQSGTCRVCQSGPCLSLTSIPSHSLQPPCSLFSFLLLPVINKTRTGPSSGDRSIW